MERFLKNPWSIVAAFLVLFALLLPLGGASSELYAAVPTLVGSWDPSGTNAHDGIHVVGNHAYLTDWVRDFDIVDVSDPVNPVWRSNLPITGQGMDVIVEGDYAFLAMKGGGLVIVDVSDPANPVRKSSIKADPNQDDLALHLYKAGNLVYVSDEMFGVVIYDVSSVTNPYKVGTCDIGFAESVWVEGTYAYVTGGNLGFYIYDVSDPSAPARRGILPPVGYSYDVQVAGQYAYITEGLSGLRVVDISDPWNPQHVTIVSTASDAYDVQIAGGYAYVGERQAPGHMEVFDLTDPAVPVLASRYQSTNRVNGVFPSGGLVYCAGQDRGLLILDPQLGPTPTPTATQTPTVTATPSVTPEPTATIDPSQATTLTVQVALQGRGNPPASSWQTPLHVVLESQGGLVGPYSWDGQCSDQGILVLDGVPQGVWSVTVRDGSSLANVRHGAILSSSPVAVDMGTLISGDTNLDARINILDFSILAAVYGSVQGDGLYQERADLNRDGRINILDFAMLANNYGLAGPIEL